MIFTPAVPLYNNDKDFVLPSFDEEIEENDDRIIGGAPTTIELHPHQVSLRQRNVHICGGSVITTTRVLTAAHCLEQGVQPSIYSIMAGSAMRRGDANAQIRTISRLIIHAQYNDDTSQNDIAVLHFVAPLTFGPTVQAVRLPRPNTLVPYGRLANVTGWGLTRFGDNTSASQRLMLVSKPLVTNAVCNAASSYNGRITPDMICAGFPQGGRDACRGDSGGPLTVNGVQFGIVSWGIGCALPRFPGVYARVPFFYSWIRANI